MAEVIMMKHAQTGEIKKGFIGYSWTVCIWGWIPMLCRGDLLTGGCLLGMELLYWNFARDPSSTGILFTIAQIIGGFTYNKRYTRGLVERGFRFSDADIRNQAGAAALGMTLEACAMTGGEHPEKTPAETANNTSAQEQVVPAAPQNGGQTAESIAPTAEKIQMPPTATEGKAQTDKFGQGIMCLVIVGVVLTGLMNKEKIMNALSDSTSSRSTVATSSPKETKPRLTPQGLPLRSSDKKIQQLECFDGDSSISPTGELAEIFNFGSNYTNVQRERKLEELKGKIVRWTGSVYEINNISERKYHIVPESGNSVNVILYVTALDDEDVQYIESLKTGDRFTFTGMFNGEQTLRSLDMNPAIVNRPNMRSASAPASAPVPSERKGRVLSKTTITAVYRGLDPDAPENMYVFEDTQGVKYYLNAGDEEEAKLQRYLGKKLSVTYTTETFYHEGGAGMMKDDFLQSYKPLR